MARIAKSLDVLRSKFNTMFPNRDKSSDGWIGDASHAAGASDHNPDANGVVKALDITNDPAHGLDANKFAKALAASKDPRISYIISNREICNSKVQPWVWRKYSGSNPHDKHFHISVVSDPSLYDKTDAWILSGDSIPITVTDSKLPASIKYNNPGAINAVAWVKAYPGYTGVQVIGGGNPIAIFATPEQGVALYWELLNRYRKAGAKTVDQIITRYGGGQNYSAYTTFVVKQSGLKADYEIKLKGDDENLLKFAKAMFRYEAGKNTPISDEQIIYGFNLARGTVVPTPIPTPTPVSQGFWEWLGDLFNKLFRSK